MKIGLHLNSKQLEWWSSQTADQYACAVCNKTGPKGKIQPQFPAALGGTPQWEGKALCVDCIAQTHKETKQ